MGSHQLAHLRKLHHVHCKCVPAQRQIRDTDHCCFGIFEDLNVRLHAFGCVVYWEGGHTQRRRMITVSITPLPFFF